MKKLEFIASIRNELLRKKVLHSISDECLLEAIQEIAKNYNVIKKKLNNKSKKLMKGKNERNIIALANKISINKRKKLTNQAGGWLPLIIPTVASILTSLIAK